jgi:peptidoglycan DL-endopeptidase LytF
MNRKDTIIIAVLINAGLLAILFMLAINTDEDKISDQPEISKTISEAQVATTPFQDIPLQIASSEHADIDEVDNFLRDLAAGDHSQTALVDEEGAVDLDSDTRVSAKPKEEVKTSSESRLVEITVKRGDALEKIARSNGTTVEAIKKANNLSSTKLIVGQVLKVPLTDRAGSPPPPTVLRPSERTVSNITRPAAPLSTTTIEPQYYTVKSGDNPWKIAKQFQVKFEDLLKLNGLDEEKARNLKVGDKIRVR